MLQCKLEVQDKLQMLTWKFTTVFQQSFSINVGAFLCVFFFSCVIRSHTLLSSFQHVCMCDVFWFFISLRGKQRQRSVLSWHYASDEKPPALFLWAPLSFGLGEPWCHISEAYFNAMLCCGGMELASWMAFITPQGCSSPHCSWRINLHRTHQCI